MKRSKFYTIAGILAGVAITLAVLLAFSGSVYADPGEPQPGTVAATRTRTIFPSTRLVTDTALGTTYSASPRVVSGEDVSNIRFWHAVDTFATVDVAAASGVTITLQVSPDGTNWADATYSYVANSLTATTTVITGTEGMTATTTTSSAGSPTEAPHRIILAADGTDYMRSPTAGEYMRYKLEWRGTVTLTVQATARND